MKFKLKVKLWVLQCDTCAAAKKPSKNPKAPLGKMTVGAPLDRLGIDILGPLPLTPRGNKYVLDVTDYFTKWVKIFAIPDQTAVTRVGVNSGIEWELSSIPDSIPGIGLGIGIEKKGIGIELELTKNVQN